MNSLFGLSPSAVEDHVIAIASLIDVPDASQPQVKVYADAVYFNYYALGFSTLFKPVNGYKPSSDGKLDHDNLVLDSIDIYNATATTKPKSKLTPIYSTYPQSPIVISLDGKTSDEKDRPQSISVTPMTTGKEFVECIGEPDRKGGGTGPSSGSISIWCEWSKDGIMIEFGGNDSSGAQAWEKGKDAPWKIITLYKPS